MKHKANFQVRAIVNMTRHTMCSMLLAVKQMVHEAQSSFPIPAVINNHWQEWVKDWPTFV